MAENLDSLLLKSDILSHRSDIFGDKLEEDDAALKAILAGGTCPKLQNLLGELFKGIKTVVDSQLGDDHIGPDARFRNMSNALFRQAMSAQPNNIAAERSMGRVCAMRKGKPNATVATLSAVICSQQNKIIDHLETLSIDEQREIVKCAVKDGRRITDEGKKREDQIVQWVKEKTAQKNQYKDEKERRKLDKEMEVAVENGCAETDAIFNALDEHQRARVGQLLSEDGVLKGALVHHTFYQKDRKQNVTYCGRVVAQLDKQRTRKGEKVMEKNVRLTYWNESEQQSEADGVDEDHPLQSILADMVKCDLYFLEEVDP